MHLRPPSIKSMALCIATFSTALPSLSGSLWPDFTYYEITSGGRGWPSSEATLGMVLSPIQMEDVSWAHRWPGLSRNTSLVPWHRILPALQNLLTLASLDKGYRFAFVLLAEPVQTYLPSQTWGSREGQDGASWYCLTFRWEHSLFSSLRPPIVAGSWRCLIASPRLFSLITYISPVDEL